MGKRVLFGLMVVAGCASASGQSVDAGMMSEVLLSNYPDTTKVRMLFEGGRVQWFNRNLPKANSFLKASVELAEKTGFDLYLADALNLLGNVHLKLQQYDSAFLFLQKALETEDADYRPLVYDTYSKIYFQLGDYPTALDYSLMAVDEFEKNPVERFNMLAVYEYSTIGDVLTKMGQPEKAIQYYRKAYRKGLTSPNRNWYIKDPLLKMAHYHTARNELATAKHLYDTVIRIDTESPSHEPSMHANAGLGRLAMMQNRFAEAVDYYRKALAYANQKDLRQNMENFCTQLGVAFLKSRQPDSAYYYLQRAIHTSGSSGNLNNLSEAYFHLSEWQQVYGDYKQAIQSFQFHKQYQDSILNLESAGMVLNLEILHQTRQKEAEINRLKEMEEEKDRTIRQRTIYVAFAVLAAIVLGVNLILLRKNAINRQRLHEQKVRQMEQQQRVGALHAMINGQETERTRIARDLHDGLGGLFSTMKMHMSKLEHDEPSLKNQELFQKSYSLVDDTAEEVRRIAHNMMPEVLMKLGLVNALQDLCRSISAGKLLNVSLEVHGMEQRLNASTEIMLFRIVQELLNNIIKHAQANEAIIQFIREDNRLSVIVEDNGKGFNMNEAHSKKRAGLETVESRVAYLNGTISIDSQKDVGTTVMMDFLLHDA